MRLGLLADVHGNLPALEAVLDALAEQRVDGLLCAGDLVGYGPFPNEVVARVGEVCRATVAGNHDLAALGALSFDAWPPLARETLLWTQSVLGPGARAALAALPLRVDEVPDVALAHGSLDDPEVYVVTTEQAHEQLAATPARIVVLGHTHRAALIGERSDALLVARTGTVRIPDGERVVLNPGSVGQSRDGRVRARFATLDLERDEATFHAIAYDHRRTRRALREAGLPASAHHLKIDTIPRRAARKARRLATGLR